MWLKLMLRRPGPVRLEAAVKLKADLSRM